MLSINDAIFWSREAPERPPVLRPAADDAESGRGLLIVDALADDEGVEQVAGDGKTVWASFRTDGTGAARD